MRCLGVVLLAMIAHGPATGGEPVVVGSKNFAENRLLAEMFARLLEARTELTVERRLNLAGTQVCFEALRTGSLDLYPEYTGTGLVTLLGEAPRGNATDTLNYVRAEFLRRFDLSLQPLHRREDQLLQRRFPAARVVLGSRPELVEELTLALGGFLGGNHLQRRGGTERGCAFRMARLSKSCLSTMRRSTAQSTRPCATGRREGRCHCSESCGSLGWASAGHERPVLPRASST